MTCREKEKIEAINLRKGGLSIKKIAKMLNVSSSSVCLWVKNVPLTEEQKKNLYTAGQSSAAQKRKDFARTKRLLWQEEGKVLYDSSEKDFSIGCSLYWGEGSKHRNNLSLCNTDSELLVFFVNFLRKYFFVENSEFKIVVNCYLNNGLSLEEIQKHWLNLLNLPETCLRKAMIKSRYYDGKTSGKYPYGVCTVKLGRTDILQKIYGALGNAIGIDSRRWLD